MSIDLRQHTSMPPDQARQVAMQAITEVRNSRAIYNSLQAQITGSHITLSSPLGVSGHVMFNQASDGGTDVIVEIDLTGVASLGERTVESDIEAAFTRYLNAPQTSAPSATSTPAPSATASPSAPSTTRQRVDAATAFAWIDAVGAGINDALAATGVTDYSRHFTQQAYSTPTSTPTSKTQSYASQSYAPQSYAPPPPPVLRQGINYTHIALGVGAVAALGIVAYLVLRKG